MFSVAQNDNQQKSTRGEKLRDAQFAQEIDALVRAIETCEGDLEFNAKDLWNELWPQAWVEQGRRFSPWAWTRASGG